jgi:hypothetical protein
MKVQTTSITQELNKPSTYQALIEFDSVDECRRFESECTGYCRRNFSNDGNLITAEFVIHPMQCVWHAAWFIHRDDWDSDPEPAKPNFPVTPTEMK